MMKRYRKQLVRRQRMISPPEPAALSYRTFYDKATQRYYAAIEQVHEGKDKPEGHAELEPARNEERAGRLADRWLEEYAKADDARRRAMLGWKRADAPEYKGSPAVAGIARQGSTRVLVCGLPQTTVIRWLAARDISAKRIARVLAHFGVAAPNKNTISIQMKRAAKGDHPTIDESAREKLLDSLYAI